MTHDEHLRLKAWLHERLDFLEPDPAFVAKQCNTLVFLLIQFSICLLSSENMITYHFEGLPDCCGTFINIRPLFVIPFEARLSLDFDNDIVGFLQLEIHEKINQKRVGTVKLHSHPSKFVFARDCQGF